MDVRLNFSDVDQFFQDGKNEVKAIEREEGENAVQYAIKNGSYQDRTGNLRKSNKSNVTDEGVELINSAEYASFVESKGYEVLSGAALELEKRLRERIK